jgi:putative glycerol-1-phosphate prenyltransferase
MIEKNWKKRKQFALLVDPDKQTNESLQELIDTVSAFGQKPDLLLVGGSLLFNGVDNVIIKLKKALGIPVMLFPGSALQVSNNADGIFLLSLISGRNPEFLIGHHVLAAPSIKAAGLDVVPTGYMLVDCGSNTSVKYMSSTEAIPYEKTDIAVATAMAGEMLGLRAIYLEGGSGANKPVPVQMIEKVRANISVPLIVGGGLKTEEQIESALDAGADIVVVGTALEKNPKQFAGFMDVVAKYNRSNPIK